jgi:quercetin dioxygenase-like cupin family protein
MKLFKSRDLISLIGPKAKDIYRPEVLTNADNAFELGGMFGFLPPGLGVPYHFHKKRESVIIVISGEAVENVDGVKFTLNAGDVLFIQAGEKHSLSNESNSDFRFIEFFTNPPLAADFISAEA